jgi:deazaflavin-dependent oxidoreductase (nitroreductase family)
MHDRTAKILSAAHAFVFRSTRGVIGRRLVNNDMLLLSTTGRRSGKIHTVPLLYLQDDQDLVVVASWGGRDRHPEWYLNLMSNPAVTAQIEGKRIPVQAATAGPETRARLWPEVTEAYDGYREYQSRTDREIPIVILRRDPN